MNIFATGSVICAVKDNDELLNKALNSNSDNIFLLKANINSLQAVVNKCHQHLKRVFVHIDLAEGIGKDEASIQYIAEVIRPDGIMSTKANIVKLAQEHGLTAIYRVFLIDAQAMDSAKSNIAKYHPDAVEIMPGIAYEAITELKNSTNVPIIAGGFVRTKQNVKQACQSGAVACSTSNTTLWQ